jgi:hypothetical protein
LHILGHRWVSLEHRRNVAGRGNTKYSGINLPRCHFVHHNTHTDCSRTEHRPSRWETGKYRLSHLA